MSPKSSLTVQRTALATAVTLALAGPVSSAYAAEFTVSNTDASGPGSLFAAIGSANEASDADTIVFANGVTGTIAFDGQVLAIYNPVSIIGPGSDLVTLEVNCTESCPNNLFMVSASSGDVSISGLSMDDASSTWGESFIESYGGAALSVDDLHFTQSNDNTTSNDAGRAIRHTSSADLTITNSRFEGLTMQSGGAVSSQAFNLTIEDSVFIGNESTQGRGGAVNATNLENLIVRNNRFANNTTSGSYQRGGALAITNDESQATYLIENTTFDGNEATSEGGALYVDLNINNTELTIRDSVFSENLSDPGNSGYGGALATSWSDAAPLELNIENSVFDSNEAGYVGGAMYIYTGSDGDTINIRNTTISNNTAGSSAGASIYPRGAAGTNSVNISNSTFSGNSATNTNSAGALSLQYGDTNTIEMLGVTMVNNTSPEGTGGFVMYGFVEATIVNSILANSGGEDVADIASAYGSNTVDIDYSLVAEGDGGSLNELTPGSNITGTTANPADPLLEDLADNGGLMVGYNQLIPLPTQLPQASSPVVGAGDASATNSALDLPAFDQRGDGFDRVQDGGLEMGAVELYLAPASDDDDDQNESSGGGGSSAMGPLGLLLLAPLLWFRRR